MTAPSKITAPMPTSTSSPTVQAWTIAPWPTVTQLPSDAREIVREMQHGVVLDVRVVADDDAVDVAAQHRAIPHAGMRAERHVAEDDGGLGEINALAELRLFAQERVELFHRVFHAGNLTADARMSRMIVAMTA